MINRRRFASLFALLLLPSCRDATAPLGGQRWILLSVDDTALPARPQLFTYQILADTLEFGVESTMWKARPLARGRRVVRYADGNRGIDEWWFTYEEHAASPFAMRALCADGDALASCIDGAATVTVEGPSLSIRFRVTGLGALRYGRIH